MLGLANTNMLVAPNKFCLVKKGHLIIYGSFIIEECRHMPTTFYNFTSGLNSWKLG